MNNTQSAENIAWECLHAVLTLTSLHAVLRDEQQCQVSLIHHIVSQGASSS